MTFYLALTLAHPAANHTPFLALQARLIVACYQPHLYKAKLDHINKFHFEIASPYGSMGALAF